MKSEDDLLPPGALPGTTPTDVEQATGLERFELLGKMQGIDVFDMKPLDASRLGMLENAAILIRMLYMGRMLMESYRHVRQPNYGQIVWR